MTLAGATFLAVGLMIAVVATGRQSELRWLPLVLYAYHTSLALIYAVASFGTTADSYEYYLNGRFSRFNIGTDIVGFMTSRLQAATAASYIDLFLFFQIFGYAGILLFVRTLIRVASGSKSPRVRHLIVAMAFLPGLSYWSSAIGKDGVAVLAVALVLEGISRPRPSHTEIAIGCILMLAIRPHIFVLILPALALAVGLSKSRGAASRTVIVAASSLSLLAILPFVLRYVNLSSFSSQAILSNLNARLSENEVGGGAVDLTGAPLWIKSFAYFFRPLFLDSKGLLGLVASIENAVLLAMTVLGAESFRKSRSLAFFRPAYVKFCVVYGIGGGAIVSLTLSNLGIALRQKYMFLLPILLLILLARVLEDERQKVGRRSPTS